MSVETFPTTKNTPQEELINSGLEVDNSFEQQTEARVVEFSPHRLGNLKEFKGHKNEFDRQTVDLAEILQSDKLENGGLNIAMGIAASFNREYPLIFDEIANEARMRLRKREMPIPINMRSDFGGRISVDMKANIIEYEAEVAQDIDPFDADMNRKVVDFIDYFYKKTEGLQPVTFHAVASQLGKAAKNTERQPKDRFEGVMLQKKKYEPKDHWNSLMLESELGRDNPDNLLGKGFLLRAPERPFTPEEAESIADFVDALNEIAKTTRSAKPDPEVIKEAIENSRYNDFLNTPQMHEMVTRYVAGGNRVIGAEAVQRSWN